MPRNLLTDAECRASLPKATRYRLADGDGLFLSITPAGVRSWQYRYRHDGGGSQTATLGRYPTLGLAAAREERDRRARQAAAGEHLTKLKHHERRQRKADAAATFSAVAEDWRAREGRRVGWTDDYAEEVTSSIARHLKDLLPVPVGRIDARLAAATLRPVERDSVSMSKKVRQRLRAILDHAVAEGLIPSNPLPVQRRGKGAERRHYPAVTDHEAVGKILRDARAAEASRGVKRAHELLVFTAQRSGEVTPAEWSEFDLQAGTWTIPRVRMKMKEVKRGPHVVPLPPGLLTMLKGWRAEDGKGAMFVCSSKRNANGHVTGAAVEKFYKRTLGLSGKHVPHSWRTVLKTWAGNAGKPFDVIEAQLDHINIGGKVSGSYDGADRVDPRRELMAWHESKLVAARDGAEVLSLRLVG